MNFGKWQVWIRLAFWLALSVTLVMALLPNPPALPVQANDKVQHMAAFAALTFLAALGFPSLRLRVIFVRMAALGLAAAAPLAAQETRVRRFHEVLNDYIAGRR